jgi:hypothetical protein
MAAFPSRERWWLLVTELSVSLPPPYQLPRRRRCVFGRGDGARRSSPKLNGGA